LLLDRLVGRVLLHQQPLDDGILAKETGVGPGSMLQNF
jgi:hypothetical protein